MLIFYNIGIKFYFLLIFTASFFNKKAKLWVKGRKNWKVKYSNLAIEKSTWFHFASLGEFEQGKPLIEKIKELFPDKKVVITFFSPSGYEVRKNSPLGDYILYLPLDSRQNALDFIRIFKPETAFFNKYDYWFHFYRELYLQNIPLYVTSAIFRPNQIFFKNYGSFNRRILSFVTHFFVQNEESKNLLRSIGLNNSSITGDTRFDSVSNLSQKAKDLPFIYEFKQDKKLLMIGSSWSDDEKLLSEWINKNTDNWKAIFAPHEIKENRINSLLSLFEQKNIIRHSQINSVDLSKYDIMIIDNIGMLSSLYRFADITYIGGGFNKSGIHNTLEAAVWARPVIFGPNYQKFKEAKDLVKLQAGFSYQTQQELNTILNNLSSDESLRTQSGFKAKSYVDSNIGATEKIIEMVYSS